MEMHAYCEIVTSVCTNGPKPNHGSKWDMQKTHACTHRAKTRRTHWEGRRSRLAIQPHQLYGSVHLYGSFLLIIGAHKKVLCQC
eukprot:c43661_g1_i1 orf=207-458(+)